MIHFQEIANVTKPTVNSLKQNYYKDRTVSLCFNNIRELSKKDKEVPLAAVSTV